MSISHPFSLLGPWNNPFSAPDADVSVCSASRCTGYTNFIWQHQLWIKYSGVVPRCKNPNSFTFIQLTFIAAMMKILAWQSAGFTTF